jgi:N-hydroxyarylamine O-acetyltransferase
MIDFESYLHRIGLAGTDSPSWQAIHRAHATSIPFENLDPHRGIAVSLEQPDLERKLVSEGRGGYCFEHNLLLASALEHIGLKVEPMLARVRVGRTTSAPRPTGHLVLRVTGADGKPWHADVGFGLGTLLDPIPFGADPDNVNEQSGWSFRVIGDGPELVLQTLGADGWSDVYGFVPEPVPRVDIEVSNWWTCTNPGSAFVFGLIASVHRSDGRRQAICDWSGSLTEIATTPAGTVSTELARSTIPEKLAELGLPGFVLDEDGRVRADSLSARA